jgi:signal transduction histidine kinase
LSETLSLQKDKIEKQALQLANTNQSKDKLFALLAHDLKSPIANLVNSLELWKNDKVDGFKTTIGRSFLQVYHELENVQLILNNLLQWSSLQLKDSTPHFQVVSLNQLMNFVIKQVETTATEKRITIINNLTESNIWADENQIQIVLRNIISNSLKYTPEDGFIKISSNSSSDNAIALIIRDNGLGISPENLQYIFQYPISQNGTKGEKGTGIGLSLAKELIEKNGGSIEIKSVLNKGTEVCLNFKKLHN